MTSSPCHVVYYVNLQCNIQSPNLAVAVLSELRSREITYLGSKCILHQKEKLNDGFDLVKLATQIPNITTPML